MVVGAWRSYAARRGGGVSRDRGGANVSCCRPVNARVVHSRQGMKTRPPQLGQRSGYAWAGRGMAQRDRGPSMPRRPWATAPTRPRLTFSLAAIARWVNSSSSSKRRTSLMTAAESMGIGPYDGEEVAGIADCGFRVFSRGVLVGPDVAGLGVGLVVVVEQEGVPVLVVELQRSVVVEFVWIGTAVV